MGSRARRLVGVLLVLLAPTLAVADPVDDYGRIADVWSSTE